MDFLHRAWSAWKRVGRVIGDFIGRLALTVFYFTLFLPFGLVVRIAGDPLALKGSGRASNWLTRTLQNPDLEGARRQF